MPKCPILANALKRHLLGNNPLFLEATWTSGLNLVERLIHGNEDEKMISASKAIGTKNPL